MKVISAILAVLAITGCAGTVSDFPTCEKEGQTVACDEGLGAGGDGGGDGSGASE